MQPAGERSLLQCLGALVAGGAVHGFCIGSAKSLLYGTRSAIKVPLLLLGTAVICAMAYHVVGRTAGLRLSFLAMQRASLRLFAVVALALASLAPVSLFLGQTMEPPVGTDLGGYPGFVGIHVVFTAVAGCTGLWLQARTLLAAQAIGVTRARVVTGSWLALSLLVGGQLAFYLRPFFGIASLTGEPPFLLGDEPTATGARNFYEVVWQFVTGARLQ
jgi:hypothetical protein